MILILLAPQRKELTDEEIYFQKLSLRTTTKNRLPTEEERYFQSKNQEKLKNSSPNQSRDKEQLPRNLQSGHVARPLSWGSKPANMNLTSSGETALGNSRDIYSSRNNEEPRSPSKDNKSGMARNGTTIDRTANTSSPMRAGANRPEVSNMPTIKPLDLGKNELTASSVSPRTKANFSPLGNTRLGAEGKQEGISPRGRGQTVVTQPKTALSEEQLKKQQQLEQLQAHIQSLYQQQQQLLAQKERERAEREKLEASRNGTLFFLYSNVFFYLINLKLFELMR